MTLTTTQSYIMYIVFAVCVYVFAAIDDLYKVRITRSKYFNRIFTVLIFLAMFLIVTYRNCGTDTSTYEYTFIHNRSQSTYDIIYFGLLRFVRNFTANPIVWQGVMGGTVLLCIWISSELLEDIVDRKMYLLYSIVYLYYFTFNYSRMLMSVGILILAFSFLIKKSNVKFVVLIILAGLIHYSSFSALLVYVLYLIGRKHRKLVITIGIIGVLILRIRPDLVRFFILADHYSIYVADRMNSGFGIGTLLQTIPYFVLLYFSNNLEEDKQTVTFLYVLLIASVAFGFLGYAIPVASRIARFTFAFPCMFIPAYIVKCKKKAGTGNIIQTQAISLLWIIIVYFVQVQSTFEMIGIIPYVGR